MSKLRAHYSKLFNSSTVPMLSDVRGTYSLYQALCAFLVLAFQGESLLGACCEIFVVTPQEIRRKVEETQTLGRRAKVFPAVTRASSSQ